MKIEVKEWSIGPRSDPYSACNVEVDLGTKRAEFYFDGLGENKLHLYEKGDLVKVVRWCHMSGRGDRSQWARNQAVKARLLFKRHVGTTVDDAIDSFYSRFSRKDISYG